MLLTFGRSCLRSIAQAREVHHSAKFAAPRATADGRSYGVVTLQDLCFTRVGGLSVFDRVVYTCGLKPLELRTLGMFTFRSKVVWVYPMFDFWTESSCDRIRLADSSGISNQPLSYLLCVLVEDTLNKIGWP